VESAVAILVNESAEAEPKADFLRALAAKGETDSEIAAFVEALLARAVDPAIDPAKVSGPMIDVCGTGGDRLDLFNVSTTSMFVLAAGGAAVVKHGNRSISSKCGGADVLEALGVRIDLSPEQFRETVARLGFGFLFAPHYHPAFKAIGPVRKTLADQGVTTVFNLLGPLLNPARPAHQLVGIFSFAALPKYASVLQKLGRTHAWAVHGQTGDGAGMDEISTMGTTHVYTVQKAGISSHQLAPESLNLHPAAIEELKGGNREENAKILVGILDGTLRGPKRDMVTLNAGAGFVVANLAADLETGFAMANEQIDSGAALAKLRALQDVR
jgi:anthranilate phosphoribosyltransferase